LFFRIANDASRRLPFLSVMSHIARTRALILSRPAVIAGLIVAFTLILVTALLSAASTRGVALADQRTAKAEHTLSAANGLVAALADATNATRNYADTSDEKHAALFRAAHNRARTALTALQHQLRTQPRALPMLAQLRKSTEARFSELDRTWRLLRERDPALAPTGFEVEARGRTADEVRQLAMLLQKQEFVELAEQSAIVTGRAEIIRALNLGLVATAVALAGAVVWWLLRRMRELEGLITVCAWTRRVKWQGNWMSFEDYLAQRFNLLCTHGICEEAAEQMRREAPPARAAAEVPALRE
jgi:CHASE3 domain sensor protein